MDIDLILDAMNRHHVAYLLLGGVNFLLRHTPVVTFDVDLWIADTPENLASCEHALAEVGATWGPTENQWQPVADLKSGWIARQSVFCMTSPHGPIDIFRSVRGLDDWATCRSRAEAGTTAAGTPYLGISDRDMLQCQLALPEPERKLDRIRILEKSIARVQNEPRSG